MIVLDIECSGIYPEKHGIWQIGALDLDNPSNYFLEECRIDDDDEVFSPALDVIDKTEEQLRDKTKQSQKEILESLFKWCEKIKNKNCICQNPVFDLGFIMEKARKHKLDSNLPCRSFDLHAIAGLRHYQLNNKFLISEKTNNSDMNLTNILKFCGLEDTRRSVDVKTRKVLREGTMHNALEDAKLTAECFSRLVYGKELLLNFKCQPLPEYLKNINY